MGRQRDRCLSFSKYLPYTLPNFLSFLYFPVTTDDFFEGKDVTPVSPRDDTGPLSLTTGFTHDPLLPVFLW